MSYCRFSDSDAYLYYDVNGYYNCCACRLTEPTGGYWKWYDSVHMNTPEETIAHMEKHVEAGHDIDPDVFKRLERDRKEWKE